MEHARTAVPNQQQLDEVVVVAPRPRRRRRRHGPRSRSRLRRSFFSRGGSLARLPRRDGRRSKQATAEQRGEERRVQPVPSSCGRKPRTGGCRSSWTCTVLGSGIVVRFPRGPPQTEQLRWRRLVGLGMYVYHLPLPVVLRRFRIAKFRPWLQTHDD